LAGREDYSVIQAALYRSDLPVVQAPNHARESFTVHCITRGALAEVVVAACE